MARRRQRHGARVSRTHATEGESNGIQNRSTINGDTNETSLANVTANVTDNLHNPSLSEGRKLVRVSKGLENPIILYNGMERIRVIESGKKASIKINNHSGLSPAEALFVYSEGSL
ncbi:hypothetical protein Tco_0952558 [Tanacetum coccineum]|uniref:Uncharacterized protein n=1 Tax=Tanacetum coccineum TaxID=301880 RepID=A0ABQ5E070_9ASTR